MPKIKPLLLRCAIPILAAGLLSGCLEEIPGMGPPPKVAAKQKEDRATDSACRYAVRSIEDCYLLNPKATRNDVFTGWKEMDAYMRENKIEGVPSVLTPSLGAAAATAPKEEIITESATGSK